MRRRALVELVAIPMHLRDIDRSDEADNQRCEVGGAVLIGKSPLYSIVSISPPARVPTARHTANEILLLTVLTDPSAITACTIPG